MQVTIKSKKASFKKSQKSNLNNTQCDIDGMSRELSRNDPQELQIMEENVTSKASCEHMYTWVKIMFLK